MSDLKFSKDHEWVREEGDTVVVGVTDFAADQLGDVVYVDLPEVGDSVEAHTEMGEIESTKSVSDLFSPVTGEVIEINEDVVDEPEKVNEDPFGAAWLIKVKVESLPDDLMSKDEYDKLTQS
ncbi:glycine cleavage system protein GcvH [Helcobacillus massiliensis]|uniref:Glycine cleavage system H protein n=1 Tax=Helcobacillus massiliensis TaxID=521392 RepID=A0A839QZ75_9MICO|nr:MULTISPECIES: glycine cleavage system protein GcvH [Helcobacillus]MBB3022697.1 glycine cleavage system H protein [Helcobacillus massiliensis]MCG7426370.1 glycine cleavage system protein GcvH [Helcobacillus sp. ACRRO]MCT1558289.1 glycine cleavage system protein GcvH [Helcobacillus massiliensis]MCT2035472.1 glycine cleavage system protein GcvH [Helcobacillus massiliensis]MCT2332034.1 glycine cleavage system protein GcvH [Helcobacillus massiliensis]